MPDRDIYSDINQVAPDQSDTITDISSVYQSIGNILGTAIGSRFFLPDFGSALHELIFEPMDDVTEALIYDAIIEAIQKWEPRVKIDYARTVVTGVPSEHRYDITVSFYIIGFEGRQFEYTGELISRGTA